MNLPHPTHVRRAVAALTEVWRRERPADAILAALFRAHRGMGGRDRAQVSNMVYGVLRDLRALRAAVGDDPEALIATYLERHHHLDADAQVALGLVPAVPTSETGTITPLSWAVAANLPDTLAKDFRRTLPEAEWRAAAAALNEAGTVDFRVNRGKAHRDDVLDDLQRRDIAATPMPWAPDGIRLRKRLPQTDPLLAQGVLIPQDEGSQWLVACLPLAPHQQVLDYCAGAGGKALGMAARQPGLTVLATDADAARLARLPQRATRSGAHGIEVISFPPPETLRVDGVLVDAPCSGTGTLRRAPERRLDTPDLIALSALQLQILSDAAQHVAPGGWLVYATCSLLGIENEDVANTFTTHHTHFEPLSLPQPAAHSAPQIRLWPHRHGTDGFFAAGWRRR